MVAGFLQASRPDHASERGLTRYAPGMNEERDLDRKADSASGEVNPSQDASTLSPEAQAGPKAKRRGPPPNPLYHPLFLPVLLIAFALWFGYDGFLTSDPDMLEHQNFNRIMFAIMLPICIWRVPKGIREFREDQAKAASQHSGGNST